MAKPRLYLFHGNDSRASGAELRRWVAVFLQKYGNATQYILHADEMPFDELAQRLSQALQTQSLFPEPRFIVVKRLTNAHTPARVKEALQIVGSQLAGLTDGVTLVVWEDRLVPANHSLITWFNEHALKKQAEVKAYRVGTGRNLVDGLKADTSRQIDPLALSWLEQHARRLEREQRIQGKLRAGDEIASDWRVWILENILETASLLSSDRIIKKEHVEKAAGVVTESVSPFEVINAVQANDWARARRLLVNWDQTDEGSYFGLTALLRNHFRRQSGELSKYALELLAEIEIISKNVGLKQAWLLDLLLLRCQMFSGEHASLVNARRLWLSHVQRVE